MTRPNIVTINSRSPEEPVLARAVEVLQNDGIVLAPTETRYGLLARIDHPEVVHEVYHMKQRDREQPTAIFLRSVEEIERYAHHNDDSVALAKQFLPGPLTLVLKARRDLSPPLVVDGRIGIRVSSSAVIAGLLERTDFHLTATSANLSGKPEAETAAEIAAVFGDAVPVYLDAGPLRGRPSTVIDCTGSVPTILRSGAIGEEEINGLIGRAT